MNRSTIRCLAVLFLSSLPCCLGADPLPDTDIYLISSFMAKTPTICRNGTYYSSNFSSFPMLQAMAAWLLPVGGKVYGSAGEITVLRSLFSGLVYTYMVQPYSVTKIAFGRYTYAKEVPRRICNNLFLRDIPPQWWERLNITGG